MWRRIRNKGSQCKDNFICAPLRMILECRIGHSFISRSLVYEILILDSILLLNFAGNIFIVDWHFLESFLVYLREKGITIKVTFDLREIDAVASVGGHCFLE